MESYIQGEQISRQRDVFFDDVGNINTITDSTSRIDDGQIIDPAQIEELRSPSATATLAPLESTDLSVKSVGEFAATFLAGGVVSNLIQKGIAGETFSSLARMFRALQSVGNVAEHVPLLGPEVANLEHRVGQLIGDQFTHYALEASNESVARTLPQEEARLIADLGESLLPDLSAVGLTEAEVAAAGEAIWEATEIAEFLASVAV